MPTIRLIATDLDGTLTQHEQFTPLLLTKLQQLQAAGFRVLIVTGRAAGWVNGLVHYLPVAGAIAENGGLFFSKTQPEAKLLAPIADWASHREELAKVFAQLKTKLPQLQESFDNRFRLTDWTFEVSGLSLAELDWLQQACQSAGWGFTYSTVQCHIRLPQQDKAPALETVLETYFPSISPGTVLTVGDSPNDESLFDPSQFAHSVGVANVVHYRDRLQHLPRYVTPAAEVAGFSQLVEKLLASRH
ncbi:HAD family hydrolase [Almyronema epifaneia]|uniref:HAD family hydrolase n=1 Tax=Almyronema epifaneia S1 TaxID=2991925 RepID=A0ABW6IIB0_9CYAN